MMRAGYRMRQVFGRGWWPIWVGSLCIAVSIAAGIRYWDTVRLMKHNQAIAQLKQKIRARKPIRQVKPKNTCIQQQHLNRLLSLNFLEIVTLSFQKNMSHATVRLVISPEQLHQLRDQFRNGFSTMRLSHIHLRALDDTNKLAMLMKLYWRTC